MIIYFMTQSLLTITFAIDICVDLCKLPEVGVTMLARPLRAGAIWAAAAAAAALTGGKPAAAAAVIGEM